MGTFQAPSVRRGVILLASALLAGCGYGRIQALDDRAQAARSDIEVQLQRTVDLVPNLIEIVQTYVALDAVLIQALADGRARLASAVRSDDLRRMEEGAAELSGAIRRLLAAAERNSALPSDPVFQLIQTQLDETENEIDAACRDYNVAVEEYNAYISGFPQSVTAKVIGAQRRESFRVTMPGNGSSAEGG